MQIKMTTRIKYMLLTILIITSQACIDDIGNYEYIALSEALIDNAEPYKDEMVYVRPNSTLYIEPSITYTEGKGAGDYSYEWQRYDENTYETIEVLAGSDSSILNITLPPSMNRSGEYKVLFVAQNNQTKVKFTKRYAIVVKNTMQVGFLALAEKNDGLELEMIANNNDTLTLYSNLLELTNSEYPRKGRRPIDIATFSDVTAPSPYLPDGNKYSVYLLTDQGADRLKTTDFSFIEGDYNISKVSAIHSKYLPKQGLIPEKMNYSATGTHYIYMNNHWFFACRTMMTYFFMDPINVAYGTTDYYKPSPYIVGSSDAAVLYDMDHNRFMHQQAGPKNLFSSKEVLCTRTLIDSEGDKYMFNDPAYELVYMGHIKPEMMMPSTGFAVVKHQTTGVHEIWTFAYNASYVKKRDKFVFPSTIDYSSIRFIAHHPTEKYMYCATQDKLYVLAMTSQNPPVVDISDLIPPGHQISMFKTIYPKQRKRILWALATYDPQQEKDHCGNLRMYSTDSFTGKLQLAQYPDKPLKSGYQIPMEWKGLGKIVGLDYKEK